MEQEESYTSIASFLDLDLIPAYSSENMLLAKELIPWRVRATPPTFK